MNSLNYTQKEIREAHERVLADVEKAKDTIKGISLALECQTMVVDHLKSIMTEEEKKPEEEVEETPEEQAKE